MPRGNTKNLIPANERSKEEHRKIAINGGKRSGEVRRAKSAAKDVINMVLAGKIPGDEAKKLIQKMGLPESEYNVQGAILASTANEAIKGNVRATEYLLDLAGEAPGVDNKQETQIYTGLPARVLGRAYVDINRDIDAELHTFYDFKGGRGTLKSSYCGLKMIDRIMLDPNICGLAIKQLKNDLKDSVYSQIVWAIDELGLTEEFHCTKNPMEIKRKSTGQIIYFRGGEDPNKIKSIKTPHNMHIGVVWIEEADQIRGAAAYRNIQQSAARGGKRTVFFRSYNTPRSKQHYINKEDSIQNDMRIVHHSHFKEAPKEWLGDTFFEIAEQLKQANPTAYAHEYDGEAVGNGANIFENITKRIITDDEIKAFDRSYYGIDWGWYPDPFHFSEMYYNAAGRKLYIYGEQRYNKRANELLAKDLEEWMNCKITADSGGEGPKSIADFKSRGFDMSPAIKGPGSVDYSMKWLASLTEIIIDERRCPYTADEFTTYEYERDKDGDVISGYPDRDNHAIDSVRYAMECIWKRRGQ